MTTCSLAWVLCASATCSPQLAEWLSRVAIMAAGLTILPGRTSAGFSPFNYNEWRCPGCPRAGFCVCLLSLFWAKYFRARLLGLHGSCRSSSLRATDHITDRRLGLRHSSKMAGRSFWCLTSAWLVTGAAATWGVNQWVEGLSLPFEYLKKKRLPLFYRRHQLLNNI